MLSSVADEREYGHWIRIARLHTQAAVVDGLAVDTGRRTRFETPLWQGQFAQPMGQRFCGRIARTSGLIIVQAHMHLPVEEGTGREHHGMRMERNAKLCHCTGNAVSLQQQIVHCLLKQSEIGLILQCLTNGLPIQHPVCLRTRSTHGGPLAGIQDAKLDTGLVGCHGHDATQRIDLLHQMALADPSNRRVARHLPQCVKVVA